MRVFVNFEDKRWKKYDIDFEKIVDAVVGVKHKNAEVSITLTNDKNIRKINNQYRGINKPTNVLSFELGDDILLGDIFISFDTVMRQARDEKISFEEHVAHMVVHGVLHLLGYDHIKDKDATVMEGKEVTILKKLGYKNPYSDEKSICNDVSCCPGSKTIGGIKKFFGGVFGRIVLFMFFGAIAALGFAPFHMWWATVIGLGGAYLLTVSRLVGMGGFKRFFAIFPFSFVYSVTMFWWVVNSIYVVPELANQFAVWTVPAIIGIGIVGGIIFEIPFLVISSIRRKPACRPFVFAGVWTVILWLREWLFTGFPWNPIANISLQNIYIANSMALFGALGLTFIVVGIIASVAEIIRNKSDGLNWISLFIFILFAVPGIIYGVKNIRYVDAHQSNHSPLIRIVQPAQSAMQKASYSRQVQLQNAKHNLRTLALLASVEGDYDLVVFPETAYPYTIMPNDMVHLVRALARPTVMGANYFAAGNMYNSMLVVDSNGGISDVYSKSHLVPFGEYRPFGNLIPTPGLLTPGDGPTTITMNLGDKKFVFAPAICYEVIFSDSLVPRGVEPDAIINITNDNWFGKTPGTYQHLDMVRRQAIESGLPIIRANYSGISAFVLPDGTTVAEKGIDEVGVMDGIVWGGHNTLYRKIGRDMWMIFILIAACLGSMWMSQISNKRN